MSAADDPAVADTIAEMKAACTYATVSYLIEHEISFLVSSWRLAWDNPVKRALVLRLFALLVERGDSQLARLLEAEES